MDLIMIFSAKYLIIVPIIILGAYFLRQQGRSKKDMIVFALLALVITYLIGLIGGYLYADPRPFVVGGFVPLIPHAADNGFPSDHALLASALAMLGLYWNRKLGALLWLLAVIVAIARVYVGVHHAIDVIGSMIIAIAGVSIGYAVSNYLKSHPKPPHATA